MRRTAALVLLAQLATLGCSPTPEKRPAETAAPATRTFESARYGFAITYPAVLEARSTFGRSYLQNGAWAVFAGPRADEGMPVLALALPGSNEITQASYASASAASLPPSLYAPRC